MDNAQEKDCGDENAHVYISCLDLIPIFSSFHTYAFSVFLRTSSPLSFILLSIIRVSLSIISPWDCLYSDRTCFLPPYSHSRRKFLYLAASSNYRFLTPKHKEKRSNSSEHFISILSDHAAKPFLFHTLAHPSSALQYASSILSPFWFSAGGPGRWHEPSTDASRGPASAWTEVVGDAYNPAPEILGPEPYHLDIKIFDDNKAQIGGADGLDAPTGQGVGVTSQLPYVLIATTGPEDGDAISFTYAAQNWDSNDQSHCQFGGWDGWANTRDGDCGFSCWAGVTLMDVFHWGWNQKWWLGRSRTLFCKMIHLFRERQNMEF